MTVREANLIPGASADREPEMIESGGTARLHLTLATTDYDHVRDLVRWGSSAPRAFYPDRLRASGRRSFLQVY